MATTLEKVINWKINWYIENSGIPMTEGNQTIFYTPGKDWRGAIKGAKFTQFETLSPSDQRAALQVLESLRSDKDDKEALMAADIIAVGMNCPYYQDVNMDDLLNEIGDSANTFSNYNALSLNRFNGLVDTMNTTWEDGHISGFTAIHGGDEKTPRNPYGEKRTEFKKETVKDENGGESQVWRANQFDENGLLIASIDYPYKETKNPADLRELESSGKTSPIRKREYKYTDDDKDGLAEEMDVYENGQLTTRWTDRGEDGKYHTKYSDYNYDGDYFNRREHYDKDGTLTAVYSDYNGQYFNRSEDYDKDGTLERVYSDYNGKYYNRREDYDKDGTLTAVYSDYNGQYFNRSEDYDKDGTLERVYSDYNGKYYNRREDYDKDGTLERVYSDYNGQYFNRKEFYDKDGTLERVYSDYNGQYFNRKEFYDKDGTLTEVYSDYNGKYYNRREEYDKDGTLAVFTDVSQNGAYTKKEVYKAGELQYTLTDIGSDGKFMTRTDADGRIFLRNEKGEWVEQQPAQPEQQQEGAPADGQSATQPEQQPAQPTQPEQPEPERKQAIIHKYAEHDYQHAQRRIQEYIRRNPKSEDVIQAARANIEEMERTGQLPRGLDANGNICSNADIYLYKAIQAQELYHPDEPVYVVQDGKVTRKKDGTKTVSDKLGGSTRDLLGNLASENASECVDRVKSTEAAISARGHALLGVKTKGSKMSYRPGMKPGFEEMTVNIVEETDENGKITERVVPSSEVTEPVVPTNGTVQTPPLDGQSKDEANSPGNRGANAALEKAGRRVTDETPHPDHGKGRGS